MREVEVCVEERIIWTCPECGSHNEHKVCEEASCDVCGEWFKVELPKKETSPGKSIYVVNELNELDSNYNICHGAFKNIEDANIMAHKVFERAKADLNNNESCLSDLRVWNDDYSVEIKVDKVILEV